MLKLKNLEWGNKNLKILALIECKHQGEDFIK